jgi:hypothetical protein
MDMGRTMAAALILGLSLGLEAAVAAEPICRINPLETAQCSSASLSGRPRSSVPMVDCQDGCYSLTECTGFYIGQEINNESCEEAGGYSYCFAGSCWDVIPSPKGP